MILAIETSSVLCSIALWEKGRILAEYNHELPRLHATLLGQLVDNGLNELQKRGQKKEIDAIAVAIGPGSFTGLRIGLSFAQGYCFGKQCKIVGVSNHQQLGAQAVPLDGPLYSVIDAMRDEVYMAELETNSPFEIKTHKIVKKQDLPGECARGSRLVTLPGVLSKEVANALREKGCLLFDGAAFRASRIAELASTKLEEGCSDDPEKLEPLYIRPFAGSY